jgi:hypothetical protein
MTTSSNALKMESLLSEADDGRSRRNNLLDKPMIVLNLKSSRNTSERLAKGTLKAGETK